MNIENAEVLIKLVDKKIINKKENLVYDVVGFKKYTKIFENKKMYVYKLYLQKIEFLKPKNYEIIGSEDKMIAKMREFEIYKD